MNKNGFVELNNDELMETDGGYVVAIGAGIIIGYWVYRAIEDEVNSWY